MKIGKILESHRPVSPRNCNRRWRALFLLSRGKSAALLNGKGCYTSLANVDEIGDSKKGDLEPPDPGSGLEKLAVRKIGTRGERGGPLS